MTIRSTLLSRTALVLVLPFTFSLQANAQEGLSFCADIGSAPCLMSDGSVLESLDGMIDPTTGMFVDPSLPVATEGEIFGGSGVAEGMEPSSDAQDAYSDVPLEETYVEPMPAEEGFVEPFMEPAQEQYIEPAQEQYIEPAQEQYIDPAQEQYIEPVQEQYIEPMQEPFVEPSPEAMPEPMVVEPEYTEPQFVEPSTEEFFPPESFDEVPTEMPVDPMIQEPVFEEPPVLDEVYQGDVPIQEVPAESVEPVVPVESVPPFVEEQPFVEPDVVAPVAPEAEILVPEEGVETLPVLPSEETVLPMPEVGNEGAVAPEVAPDVSQEPAPTPMEQEAAPMVPGEVVEPQPVDDIGTQPVEGGEVSAPLAPVGAPVLEEPVIDTEVREAAEADPVAVEAVEVLEQVLTEPVSALDAATVADVTSGSVLGVVERQITTTRRAQDEYQGAVSARAQSDSAQAQRDRRDRQDRLESAGLGFIAGLVVGSLIADRQEVVALSSERVVVVDRTTNVYQVWRDDDVLLRRPGTQETMIRFADGSTRTELRYSDGTSVETIRDATGRVVYRQRTAPSGRYVLIDETRPVQIVNVINLPAPRIPVVRISPTVEPVFGAELVRSSHTRVDRVFSLGQVRNVYEVRRLAPALATEPVLFETGSASLNPNQAARLAGLAGIMIELLRTIPQEMFLVEGHTDAVGSAGANLALSDRRAETVAQALVEYFGVPAENLIFQGYGESLLLVPTGADEPRNRRVDIRRITPLLTGQQ